MAVDVKSEGNDAECNEGGRPTISHFLQKVVGTWLQSWDGLIVEQHHLAPSGDWRAGQGQKCGIDVLLPKVTN
jgi:hypothetical protein